MRRSSAIAYVLAFASVTPAYAQVNQDTGSLDVRLIVEEACEISWPGSTIGGGDAELDFGTTSRIDAAIDREIGTGTVGGIEIRCNAGTTYDVAFGTGENAANVDGRAMRGAVNTAQLIPYQIYSDAARTNVLSVISVTANGAYQPLPIYGRVPPLTPAPPADRYTDNVIVTVSF
ncbi:spore coat U domain-containing protein [Sphingomonas sp. MJ1 (PH-R8)]|uniref:Csu type fimbrial protein n=1 Tax=Sphingomonas sp. MJ1 (PH-R8) TaxID=3112950 RepID=UPI003A86F5B2